MQKTISFKLTKDKVDSFVERFKGFETKNTNEYVLHAYKINDISIVLYSSLSVVINGENGIEIAKEYGYKEKEWLITTDNFGSDEVGTGDFFGPIVVVASYVKENQIAELTKLGINDSKKLSDSFILKTVPSLLSNYPHKVYILDNETYNNVYSNRSNINLNKIKALMHNKVLTSLKEDISSKGTTVIDQFCPEDKYYEYIKESKKILQNITFMTKAESYVPSVALSSMIARYVFLTKISELEKEYNIKLPLGAGHEVEKLANALKDKPFLNKIAKLNFKTLKK